MKKIILNLLVLLSIGGNAWAGDTPVIEVADVEALPGETVSFAVNLTDGKANTYTAMTLYAQFPTTGFTTTGAYTVSDAWTGTSAAVGDVDETGLATIPFASSNKIPGAQDNLATVSFKVAESVAVGEYDVTLKGTLFEYNTSDKDYAANVTFKVKVVSAHTVILDETSTTAPTAATGVNVRVKRTIKANEWSTICLPFSMTEMQIKTAFGDDVELGDFTGYDYDEELDKITVKFNSTTAIEKNHPYIIKVSAAVSEFSAEGIDIDPEEEPTVAAVKRTKKAWSEMIGTYVANTVIGEEEGPCLFLNGNRFWYSYGQTKMKAFRAYFDFYDEIENKEATSRIVIMMDETTGISENKNTGDSEGSRLYDFGGRCVEKPGKGLFIKNGKKVIIK